MPASSPSLRSRISTVVAFPLGPPRVHAHEHLRPVLRLGAARAGADLELRVAEVVRTGQQRSQSERLDLLRRAPRFALDLGGHLRIGLSGQHLLELAARFRRGRSIASNGSIQASTALHLLHDGLRASAGHSRIRRGHPLLELPQRVALGIEVKDTSAARQAARRTRLSCRARSLSAISPLPGMTRAVLRSRQTARACVSSSLQDSVARGARCSPRRASSDLV